MSKTRADMEQELEQTVAAIEDCRRCMEEHSAIIFTLQKARDKILKQLRNVTTLGGLKPGDKFVEKPYQAGEASRIMQVLDMTDQFSSFLQLPEGRVPVLYVDTCKIGYRNVNAEVKRIEE